MLAPAKILKLGNPKKDRPGEGDFQGSEKGKWWEFFYCLDYLCGDSSKEGFIYNNFSIDQFLSAMINEKELAMAAAEKKAKSQNEKSVFDQPLIEADDSSDSDTVSGQ